MNKCKCETPTPWENAKGDKTNVCKKCKGVIKVSPAVTEKHDPIGRLMIRLYGSVMELEFENVAEREAYLSNLAENFPTRLRQNLATWRLNRKPVPKT